MAMRTTACLVTALVLAGCGIEKAAPPPLSGPSGFAVSLELSASPDQLPRDGASAAVITIRARNAEAAPLAGQRVVLGASAGTLSAGEVVTDAGGIAGVTFTAPAVSTGATEATITARAAGTNAANTVTHSIRIPLFGPALPVPGFGFSPQSPSRFQTVTFDATATQLDGSTCGSRCTYAWDMGGEDTRTGQTVTYAFQEQRPYVVRLTVTVPATGAAASTQQTVVVGAAVLPTASFVVSPTNPRVGDTVHFNASASTAANGATIREYRWDFGNGQTLVSTQATGASIVYTAARTYTVQLVVVDSNGLQAVREVLLTVAAP